MIDEIRAPWTSEQVDALNRFQQEGGGHPFTCGKPGHQVYPRLTATHAGWVCPDPDCDFTQDWALALMTDPAAWPRPFADLRKQVGAEGTEPANPVAVLTAALARAEQHAKASRHRGTQLVHNGWAEGLREALRILGQDDEQQRTTPDSSSASSDPADNPAPGPHPCSGCRHVPCAGCTDGQQAALARVLALADRLARFRAWAVAQHAKAKAADETLRRNGGCPPELRTSLHDGTANGIFTVLYGFDRIVLGVTGNEPPIPGCDPLGDWLHAEGRDPAIPGQTAGCDGPSVREAADNDRRWALEKEGE
ncbi:hypothetical protein [Streptomyces sp. NPDC059786]|uniref:hypothetical protein n=1 Tax=Streptomyces sp. NPDC059786 TaxID=3346946 RepID=UPI003649B169